MVVTGVDGWRLSSGAATTIYQCCDDEEVMRGGLERETARTHARTHAICRPLLFTCDLVRARTGVKRKQGSCHPPPPRQNPGNTTQTLTSTLIPARPRVIRGCLPLFLSQHCWDGSCVQNVPRCHFCSLRSAFLLYSTTKFCLFFIKVYQGVKLKTTPL